MSIEVTLAECLIAIEAGELSVEEALQRHPDQRAELEPLLRAAMKLRQLERVTAPARLRVEGRARLLDRITATQTLASPAAPVVSLNGHGHTRTYHVVRRRRLSILLRSVAAAAATVALLVGTLTASATSLPGDALYPAKLWSEQIQVTVASSDEERVEHYLTFAERRLVELERRADQLSPDEATDLLNRYHEQISAAESVVESAPLDSPLRQEVEVEKSRHAELLASLSDRLPVAHPEIDENTPPSKSEPPQDLARDDEGDGQVAPQNVTDDDRGNSRDRKSPPSSRGDRRREPSPPSRQELAEVGPLAKVENKKLAEELLGTRESALVSSPMLRVSSRLVELDLDPKDIQKDVQKDVQKGSPKVVRNANSEKGPRSQGDVDAQADVNANEKKPSPGQGKVARRENGASPVNHVAKQEQDGATRPANRSASRDEQAPAHPATAVERVARAREQAEQRASAEVESRRPRRDGSDPGQAATAPGSATLPQEDKNASRKQTVQSIRSEHASRGGLTDQPNSKRPKSERR